MLHELAAALLVGADAVDAEAAQGVVAVLQQVDALKQGVGDDGLHDVELQLAVVAGQADGHVVADDAVAHLVHHLGDDGVHLAGHDARTGLALGEVYLVQAAAGTAGEQAQVVADLVGLHGQALHGGAVGEHAGGGAGGLDEVVGQGDVPAGDLAQSLDAGLAVAGLRADARADGGGTHVHNQELVGSVAEVLVLAAQRVGKGAESLAEGHGHGILQLRAAHLDNILELLALLVEGGNHLLQVGHELQVLKGQCHVDGAGIGVVGALAGVHHVVGRAVLVLAALVAHALEGQVGDDLVGTHVGAGAGTALNHIDGELVVVLALDQLVAGPHDGVALLLGNHLNLDVRHGGGLLGDGHAADKVVVVAQQLAADVEILHGAGSLYAV